MKRISASVFYLKRVFPVIWFGFLAIFIAKALTGRAAAQGPLLPFIMVAVAMALFGFVLLRKFVYDLADEVTDGGDFLVVRFGDVEDRIALSNIINVSYTMMMNPPRVTLSLRQPCRFGKKVSFSPPRRWSPFSNSPIITDLIERIDVARRRAPAT
jgi:hypothetical protein